MKLTVKTVEQKFPAHSAGLDLALDRYVCYPMECVALLIRVSSLNPGQELLCIHLPQTIEIESVSMEGVDENFLRYYLKEYDGTLLTLPLEKYWKEGSTADIRVNLRLNSLKMNHYLSFCVWMSDEIPDTLYDFFHAPESSKSIEVAVKANADFMHYLPELYSYDDFMNRFLMMFESFWKPINTQISQVEDYFDPDLTPEVFLTWLASWVGMEIDETFPKDRIRLLIRQAMPFYHCRGTAASLKLFLELYSGGQVEIVERRARNMVLGGKYGIGDNLALGRENMPNSVCINMSVSSAELERTGFSREKYQKKIGELARKIVPAHSVFTVQCKFE